MNYGTKRLGLDAFSSSVLYFGCDAVTAPRLVFDVCWPVVTNIIHRLRDFQVYSVHWSTLAYSKWFTANKLISFLF